MTIGIFINVIFFFVMGICSIVRPNSIVSFVELIPQTVNARNEVRAVYGGFGIAISALLVLAAYNENIRLGVLITVAGALLGMAFGRIISLFIERPGFWPIFAIFMESGLAALLLVNFDWELILAG